MDSWVTMAGIIFLGTITPGPNNFLVLRAHASAGRAAAMRSIAGIVAGGLGLLLVVLVGSDWLLDSPAAALATLACSGALAILGARILATAGGGRQPRSTPPTTAGSVFLLQFLNPKAWILVATAASVAEPGGLVLPLALLLVLIPAASLFLWLGLGSAALSHLDRRHARIWIDRATGAAFVGLGSFLLIEVVREL